jgi:hypothetical protein
MPDGTYTVSWQVSFPFSSPVADTYRFSIRPPAPATTKPATPKPTPTPTPTVTRTPSATRTPEPTRTTQTPRATTDQAIVAAPTTTPPATAAAPNVEVISATGAGSVPPPPVLWGLITVLGLAGFLVRRWRRGA